MKVAFIQTSPVFGKIKENVEAAIKRINRPDMEGVLLLVLPELFSTGYQFKSKAETLALSEGLSGGYAVERLIESARKKNMHIVAGIAEREGPTAYNSSVLVGPRGYVGTYRKAHLFSAEKNLFAPGNIPFNVYNVGNGVKIGMMICFDWLFPEAARTLALKGAHIICHPSNLVLPYCPEAMITRCLENRVFAITANRVGAEERVKGRRLKFIGRSQIVSPKGEVLLRAGGVKVEARVFDIDPFEACNKNITPLNHIFKDRRKDLYYK